MPSAEIERLVRVGTGRLDQDDAPVDDDEIVLISDFMIKVRKTVVRRFSPYEERSDAEKRADFLRNVNEDERKAIKLCFDEFDEDGDGCIDMTELGALMQRIYGFEPTSKALAKLMIEIDTDGNGFIDIDEFISAMATVNEVRIAGEIFKWRQAFDKHDVDNSGELSSSELLSLVGELWGGRHHDISAPQALDPSEDSEHNTAATHDAIHAEHLDMIQFMVRHVCHA